MKKICKNDKNFYILKDDWLISKLFNEKIRIISYKKYLRVI